MNLKNQLKTGKKKIAIWGLGYIGFSSMAYFARAGVYTLGTDVIDRRIKEANSGHSTNPNLNYWLNFDTEELAKKGMMKATKDWTQLISNDIAVHLIAIPTEKDGKPYHNILRDVITKLTNYKKVDTDQPPLIIVESTLTPTAAENIVIPIFEKNNLKVGEDILLGVAPRRDWFTSSDKSLKNLPRVVGGTNKKTTDLMAQALGIICDTVIKAPDHKHAAIVKSIENAYRQVDITFANQLSRAYPDMNIKEVLRFVGTKWNIGTFRPSFGTGGYCIPLAPQYVLEGAKNPEELTIIKESLKTDFSQPKRVVDNILKRQGKNIAVLGVTYLEDLKVHVLSPSLAIIKSLKEKGAEVKVNDPYYSNSELKELTDCETFSFPQDLSEFDTILVCVGHLQYKSTNHKDVLNNLRKCKLILDNSTDAIWKEIEFPDTVEYHEAGDANWLE